MTTSIEIGAVLNCSSACALEAFALDCGYAGPPFRCEQERRFLLRCERDAAYFHLYLGTPAQRGQDPPSDSLADGEGAPQTPPPTKGDEEAQSCQLVNMFPTPRHAVDYIMESFPVVKRKGIKARGDYRTKLVILDLYDQMQQAIETGEPFQTSLDPPPADPRVAHPPREQAAEQT